jgi:hypothetical protein
MTYKEMHEQWKADAARWPEAILELRARVEALTIANTARTVEILCLTNAVANQVPDRTKLFVDAMVDDNDYQPSSNSSQNGSSLVERVEDALMHEVGLRPMACAAIREVAAWMTSNPDVYFPPALVFALEQETER